MIYNDGRVVSNFIVQAIQNQDITIYGDGKQTRCFQYVDDLLEGMIRMMQTDDHVTGPVNIGNPVKYTILELAETIVAMTGSKSRTTFQPLPPDDPAHREPDIGLAKDILGGWAPKVELEKGLELTIKYFEDLLKN